jgi:NhaA family Na+:H+ antiporter
VRAQPDGGRFARILSPLQRFLHAEASGGVVLLAATAAALMWANSSAGEGYDAFWHTELRIGAGAFGITEDLQHWVNDLLMALFFFVVGLEIKRELVVGELRDRRAAALPAVAAIGGVVLPAALFLLIVGSGPAQAGWGIPMATDIAFAVGVMALLGNRVSAGAKLFLLSLAIVDDIIAITVIALFYSDDIAVTWLAAAVIVLVLVAAAWRVGLTRWWLHVPLALIAWVAVFNSGVHATIAGVALGLLVPARPINGREVLVAIEHRLHPVAAYLVVPLFALANAGVDLGGEVLGEAAGSRLAWAIVAGLVVGKILGVAGAAHLAVRFGWGTLPEGTRFPTVWGLAALAGIGFTVSLFIAGLAYDDPALVNEAKIGILVASAIAGVLGALLLLRAARRRIIAG